MTDTITITTTVKITDEDVDDIMETAGWGIDYWAVGASKADWEIYQESCDYLIKEDEDGTIHPLTRNDIRQAIASLADPSQTLVGSMVHGYILSAIRNGEDGRLDLGDIDSDAGDCIVQVACFGEIVYG